MRELKILNKNYEVANLYTVVYEGYTIKEIIEDAPVFSVTPPQHYLDYWQKIYDYFKTGTKVPGYTYLPQGQSKYDVAYVNKTIDDPIAELNGHTLREVFEEGNMLPALNDSNWTVSATGNTLINDNGGLKYVFNNNLPSISSQFIENTYSLQTSTGDKLVSIVQIKGDKVSTYRVGQQNAYPLSGNIESEYTTKVVLTEHVSNSRFYLMTNANEKLSLNDSIYIKDMKLINLTDFGISPMIDMEYYYSLYQARKNITKKLLTYAEVFEEIQELSNPNFDDGTMDWSYYLNGGNPNLLVTDGIGTFTSDSFKAIGQSNKLIQNNVYYFIVRAKGVVPSSLSAISYENTSIGQSIGMTPLTTEYQNISIMFTHTSAITNDFGFGRTNVANTVYVDYSMLLNLKNFDESITKEQLDTMLAHYLQVKNIVIYPEIYVPTDPTGFGNRYSFLEINKKVYGHELDFENMQLNLLFGVYRNAYDSYNQLMNFIIGNEGIISYDYGKGVRYSDIRLIKSPKTELDDGRYLKEKFDFKRLTPFYTLEQGSSLTIKNIHDWDLKLIVSGTVNTNIVYIEAEETTSGLTKTVKFDFTAVTKPFNFYYNSETKQILINGINNGYQYIDFTQGISFISLPKDTEHLIWTTGITNPSITIKKWVID